MARPKGKIDTERCKRLKQILDETKTDQKWLANKIYISEQTISKIINCKANVTETTAKLVTDLFPEYSIDWLMGRVDYRNNAEKLRAVVSEMQNEGNLLFLGLGAFAKLCDYQIDSPVFKDHCSVEEALKTIREGYTILKDDQTVQLSIDEMNAFENEVCDFVELKLKHLFKQKGAKNNG